MINPTLKVVSTLVDGFPKQNPEPAPPGPVVFRYSLKKTGEILMTETENDSHE